MNITALHTKYRPTSLKTIIGHENAVTRLRGIVESGNLPNALLITGPSGVGKTTLARAFASDLNGGTGTLTSSDYIEVNVADTRSIDDIRELARVSKHRSIYGKKKVIVLDEAQALIGPALACALKTIEEPSADTVWILCSMEPQKFKTGQYKALANRCVQINLELPSNKDLLKQAIRICKGEQMTYMMTEGHRLLKKIVMNSNGEMRTLAQLIEACQQYYNGLKEKPEQFSEENLSSVISTIDSAEDQLAIDYLVGIYTGQYAKCCKSVLASADSFSFVNAVIRLNSYLLYSAVLQGEKSSKVWHSSQNLQCKKAVGPQLLGAFAAVNAELCKLKAETMTFVNSTDLLLTTCAYNCITKLMENK